MTLKPILYDLPAYLYKKKVLDHIPRTGESVEGPDRIYGGTLGSCIREFMEKPVSQHPLYEIFTDAQDGLSKTILTATDILDIASRGDFPKD
jgi:hypothetical protein